jgi:hypothetical protein
MIGIPQFCCDEDVLARHPSRGKSCLQGLAHLALVPVSFRTVDVSKSGFQCVSGSIYRRGCIEDQGAKSKYGHMPGSVVERHFPYPKIGGFDHGERLNGVELTPLTVEVRDPHLDSSGRVNINYAREIRLILLDEGIGDGFKRCGGLL